MEALGGSLPRPTAGPEAMSAAALAAATPASRDRYVDLLRAASIAVVVLGHWIMAAITYADGQLDGTNILGVVPAMQLLTWVFQVMPVFFLVGGYANAASLESAARRGLSYAEWLRGRSERLLRPTVAFAGLWIVGAAVAGMAGFDGAVLVSAAHLVAVPLWFLTAYLAVIIAAPALLALHRRFGIAALFALGGSVVALDVLRLGVGIPHASAPNYLLMWFAVHHLGFMWRDGTLTRSPATARLMMGGGLAAIVALTTIGPYPISMVGLPDQVLTNSSPPTAALLALAVWQAGLVLALHGRVSRWLQRARVWTVVVAANGVAMTVYLWHLTALVVGVALLYPLGFPQPPAGSLAWWLLRPVWIGVLGLFLAPFVAALSRVERPRPHTVPEVSGRSSTLVAVVGAIVVCVGLGTFTLRGFHLDKGLTGMPLTAALTLAVGLALLSVSVRARR